VTSLRSTVVPFDHLPVLWLGGASFTPKGFYFGDLAYPEVTFKN